MITRRKTEDNDEVEANHGGGCSDKRSRAGADCSSLAGDERIFHQLDRTLRGQHGAELTFSRANTCRTSEVEEK